MDTPEPAAPIYDSDEARLFHHGLDLFNEGEWFEAHEVWEDIWRLAGGQKKTFYQGLIQCAVTLEHLKRGNPRGARRVCQSVRPKFEGLPRIYMGIDVPRLLEQMEAVIGPILALPTEIFRPGLPHGQNLPVDASKLPRIALEYDPFEADRR